MVAYVYVLSHGRSGGWRLSGRRAIGWVLEGTVVSSSGLRRETELPRRVMVGGTVVGRAEWPLHKLSGSDQLSGTSTAATHNALQYTAYCYWLDNATRLL